MLAHSFLHAPVYTALVPFRVTQSPFCIYATF
jgi:hypothetical protein